MAKRTDDMVAKMRYIIPLRALCNHLLLYRRFVTMLWIGGVAVLLPACHTGLQAPVNIVSRSTVKGLLNGAQITANVSATFNTGRGGHSSCVFTSLPPGFTPGTLSVYE